MNQPGMSVAEAARRVGAATSTLRAWDRRYGVGPSSRTSGGHRRYTSQDIATLQALRRLTATGMPTAEAAAAAHRQAASAASTTQVTGDVLNRARQRFIEAVDALDTPRAVRTAGNVLARHGAVPAWTAVFTPELQALGEHWQHTGSGVQREHFAVGVIATALARHMARRVDRLLGSQVVAAATPIETHTLPLAALAAGLAETSVSTCVLGTLPSASLRDAIRDTRPIAVVLWSHSLTTTDPAALRDLLTMVPVVAAAGPGWRRELPDGVTQLTDLRSAVDILTSLCSRPAS